MARRAQYTILGPELTAMPPLAARSWHLIYEVVRVADIAHAILFIVACILFAVESSKGAHFVLSVSTCGALLARQARRICSFMVRDQHGENAIHSSKVQH